MFEIGNILTLADDNEYSVVDKFNDNGIIYLSGKNGIPTGEFMFF